MFNNQFNVCLPKEERVFCVFFGWSHGIVQGPAKPQQIQQQCFMGPTVLFTHLKKIYYSVFNNKFSVFSK